MSYIVSTSILGIQTFVTRFDPSASSVGPLGQPISGVVRLANMSDVEME